MSLTFRFSRSTLNLLKLNINEGHVNIELEFTNAVLSNQCTVSNMLLIGKRYHELVRSYRVHHDEFLNSKLFTKITANRQ